MSLIKLSLEIPIGHLKGDQKEFKEIIQAGKKIVKITKAMNKEDEAAMRKSK